MPTLAGKSATTIGRCSFCNSEVEKRKMTQHLKFCKQRAAVNAAHDAGIEEEGKQFEDRSLDVKLGKVLTVNQKFTYEYDFGSTTELNLKVISEREGGVPRGKRDDSVTILARNEPPVIVCKVCGKPATQVETGYFNVEENAYCDDCAQSDEDFEGMLPIVNSPRVGVCGYGG